MSEDKNKSTDDSIKAKKNELIEGNQDENLLYTTTVLSSVVDSLAKKS